MSDGTVRVTALLLGQDAFRDERGRAHVIGIFDSVSAPQLPAGFQFAIYCRLHGQGAHSLVFRILDPRGREVVHSEPVTALLLPEQGHQFFLSLGLQVEEGGLYTIQAVVDGEPAQEVPLTVDQGPDEWHAAHEGGGLPIDFQTG